MSRNRSRNEDRERDRSRSPHDRELTSRSQDYPRRDGKSGRHKRERREGRQRDDGEGRRSRGEGEGREEGEGERRESKRREGERREGREGERREGRDGKRREGGEGERREEGDDRRSREGEERGEGRVRGDGERPERGQVEEEDQRRGRGGEERGGRWRREGERDERREEGMRHRESDESNVREGRMRDDMKRQRREQRAVEDEESKNYTFGGKSDEEKDETQKEEPNFALSGKLTAETNTYKGVVIKYSEPGEARQPTTRWRLYQFKGDEVLPTLYVHRQSAYLIGRDRRVVDLPVDHPSCSTQHAVLQYRLVSYEKPDGSTGKRVRPYLIDLESTNGTYINNQKIESARYWELKEQDMLKFGYSSREYILLHEHSKDVEDSGE